jgi:pimeloyl-ACP methyl ester carboxylesterase
MRVASPDLREGGGSPEGRNRSRSLDRGRSLDLGNLDDPPVLLIMGLGAQLVLWHNEFCQKLLDRGYRVIRFDNRDVGLSSKLHGQRVNGALVPRLLRSFVGMPCPSVYRLEDMADDAAALLDHLGIDRAHIVGASMGGMIAQIFAARHPRRTAGLGIIFSSNNSAMLPPPAPKALLSLITGPSPDSPREVIVENSIRVSKIIGSPGYRKSDEQMRIDANEAYERAYYPQGIARHFAAILGSGSLGAGLGVSGLRLCKRFGRRGLMIGAGWQLLQLLQSRGHRPDRLHEADLAQEVQKLPGCIRTIFDGHSCAVIGGSHRVGMAWSQNDSRPQHPESLRVSVGLPGVPTDRGRPGLER